MSRRNYKITPREDWFKVQAWNEYGHYTCVYERNVLDASEYILNWWNKADEIKESKILMSNAIANCIELDKKLGLLRGNRDGLD